MKLLRLRLFLLAFEVSLLSTAAVSQLAVDATGPPRERQRGAMVGHGGGIGRKLALRVVVEMHNPSPDANGATVLDFVLTNSGKDDLAIPISPNSGDLEPMDAKARYTVKHLSLRVTSDRMAASILPGGADLYGSREFPATLATLTPGDSIRVLARVVLPSASGTPPRISVFVGRVMLTDETLKTLNGKTFSDTQEIGSAHSIEYSLRSLLRLPD